MKSQELRNHLKKLERRLLTIYSIGLVILFFLSLISNFLMKYQAARQATSMIQRTMSRDFRETVMTVNDVELDYFNAVIYFNQSGQRVFSLPANLDPEVFQHPSFLENLLNARIEQNLYFDQERTKKVGSVVYIFNRFSHAYWAVLIWISFLFATLPLIRYSRRWITENYKKDLVMREEFTRATLAKRVRHDIRSPLGALKVATRDLDNMTNRQKQIIKRATTRIDEIVSELELIRNLDEATLNASQKTESENISLLPIVQEIVHEKRLLLVARNKKDGGEFPMIVPEFSNDSFFLFSSVNAANLKRTISNIVDNSLDACGGGGKVEILLYRRDDENFIVIRDDGVGIPSENVSHVTEEGFTSGKKHGTGLGLYYADRDVKADRGSLKIESQIGKGTTVTISFPASTRPSWYRESIEIPKDGMVVILDDQEAIRLTLAERIDEIANVRIESFANPDALIERHHSHYRGHENILYLLDYDLGAGMRNGIEVAETLGIARESVLVTGHFDSVEIQNKCEQLGMGLIPKPFLSEIVLESI